MDRLSKTENYRQALCRVIEQHAKLTASDRQIESVPICDTTHDHYMLMSLGRDHIGRAHDILIHLRLKEGRVHIEWDGIEDGIVEDLIEAGIREEDIVQTSGDYESESLTELAAA